MINFLRLFEKIYLGEKCFSDLTFINPAGETDLQAFFTDSAVLSPGLGGGVGVGG